MRKERITISIDLVKVGQQLAHFGALELRQLPMQQLQHLVVCQLPFSCPVKLGPDLHLCQSHLESENIRSIAAALLCPDIKQAMTTWTCMTSQWTQTDQNMMDIEAQGWDY